MHRAPIRVYSAGFGGKGGGGPGVFNESNPVENGVNGRKSTPGVPPFTLPNPDAPSTSGIVPFKTYFDTRSSSSCVSWIYSTGGRGINGGGAGGELHPTEPDEDPA